MKVNDIDIYSKLQELEDMLSILLDRTFTKPPQQTTPCRAKTHDFMHVVLREKDTGKVLNGVVCSNGVDICYPGGSEMFDFGSVNRYFDVLEVNA